MRLFLQFKDWAIRWDLLTGRLTFWPLKLIIVARDWHTRLSLKLMCLSVNYSSAFAACKKCWPRDLHLWPLKIKALQITVAINVHVQSAHRIWTSCIIWFLSFMSDCIAHCKAISWPSTTNVYGLWHSTCSITVQHLKCVSLSCESVGTFL